MRLKFKVFKQIKQLVCLDYITYINKSLGLHSHSKVYEYS